MDSLPPISGAGNPPQKPSAVGQFLGRAVSFTGQAIKVLTMPVWILFVPTQKLLQRDMMNQTCEGPLLEVFKYRGSDTEDVRKKRGQAALGAMEAVGRDINRAHQYWGNPGLIMSSVEDLMGLSQDTEYERRSGCTDQQRIANIHYWILTLERDVDTNDMTPNQRLGLQVMQSTIRNAVEGFHGRNLNALAQAYKEEHGSNPTRADMAKLLVDNCLVRKGGRREQPAHLGYDFEEIKKDKADYDKSWYGRFGNAILRDYYMAEPPKGLGLDEEDAKARHKKDYYENEGPYDPTFWDGTEGRSLVDLMKHVSFEAMCDLMEDLDGNPKSLFDLRFPVTTPGVAEPLRAAPPPPTPLTLPPALYFDDTDSEYDSDEYEDEMLYPLGGFDFDEDSDEEVLLYESYSVEADFSPHLMQYQEHPHHTGKGVLIDGGNDVFDTNSAPLNAKSKSYQYTVEEGKRRPAPQRGILLGSDKPGNLDGASKYVHIEFFNPGIIGLLDSMKIPQKDRELLAQNGAEKELEDIFEGKPSMTKPEKKAVINNMLDALKRSMTLEDALAHYCGLSPVGEGKDVGELAIRTHFSTLVQGGSPGDTVSGVLYQKALQLRQGKLNEDERLFIESLLSTNGKSLKDFESFAPENIFDYFREEDLPKLIAFTSGKEVAVLKLNENNGQFEATSYAIHGSNTIIGNNIPTDSLNNGKRIVLFLDETGNYQILKPIEE